MASSPCSCLMLLTAVVSLLILSCSAQQFYPSGRYGKRFELSSTGRASSSRFGGGSRYGRSNSKENVAVVPRTDRFFLGSRYGKRGDWETTAEGSTNEMFATSLENESQQVTCLYTGITNLYRCYNRKDNSSEDTSSGQN